MKKALITGITGQDGSYLAEFLIKKGYQVHGLIRRSSSFNTERIDNLYQDPHEKNKTLILHYGDLSDSTRIQNIIRKIMPDEVYNLAAQSHVRVSFEIPEYSSDIDAIGTLRILEAIRAIKEESKKEIKFYQASTSEMFGKVVETPQKETTPFYPRSPYACAKVYSYWITKNYRESYGIFAVSGILFNHESPRRGETFVTRKITRAVVRIKEGVQDCIYLGNLDAKRDWGHAKEYVEGMWKMLQHNKADDFIIATGENHSVREFLEIAFKEVGIEIESNGKRGIEEEYIRKDTGATIVKIDPNYFRPAEVEILLGDSSKIKKELRWEVKITFSELIKEMVDSDYKKLTLELYGKHGNQKKRNSI